VKESFLFSLSHAVLASRDSFSWPPVDACDSHSFSVDRGGGGDDDGCGGDRDGGKKGVGRLSTSA
jgi:hypothetical protein